MFANADVLSITVIIVDLLVISFLLWRMTSKTATLWGVAREIYGWVALLTLYHCAVYIATLFVDNPNGLIQSMLHPVVILYMVNPLLIAIIHYRGGHVL
jgi:hypothetical protein